MICFSGPEIGLVLKNLFMIGGAEVISIIVRKFKQQTIVDYHRPYLFFSSPVIRSNFIRRTREMRIMYELGRS